MQRRLPRFERTSVAPMQLTGRDHDILRLIYRHRFLNSRQIVALIGGSEQQILRRLQLLFHNEFLERPRIQLRYYAMNGTRPMIYGLSNKGAMLVKRNAGDSYLWSEKNRNIGEIFLDHALLVSEVMVSLELACRTHGVRLLYEDELELPVKREPFGWRSKIRGGMILGVIPDRVFALEYADQNGQTERTHFFLEADRGTMPVVRKNINQSSFQRKLFGYEATWTNKVHQRYLGIHHFRVLTVTTIPVRVNTLLTACSQLKRGHGLFLFADQSALTKDLLSSVWRSCKDGELHSLLN